MYFETWSIYRINSWKIILFNWNIVNISYKNEKNHNVICSMWRSKSYTCVELTRIVPNVCR